MSVALRLFGVIGLLSPTNSICSPIFTDNVGSSSSMGVMITGIERVVLYLPSVTLTTKES